MMRARAKEGGAATLGQGCSHWQSQKRGKCAHEILKSAVNKCMVLWDRPGVAICLPLVEKSKQVKRDSKCFLHLPED
eukprot:1159839-Pelagomonas_calceolata.AAC.10